MAEPAPGRELVHMGGVSFTREQKKLIARTICKPKKREPTTDELSLFIGQCKRTGLDPFSKQIYAIFRWSEKEGDEVMTIQTSIDGFRLIAERTGGYLGKAATYWCGEDEEWKEVWLSDDPPKAAKVVVRKLLDGHVAESAAVGHWKEYVDPKSPMWKKMGAAQLAKCVEALALRQNFPNDLSGLYTFDEMAQASRPELTTGSGSGEAQNIQLPEDVEAVLARAAKLGHAGYDRATVEMALAGQDEKAIGEWVTKANEGLDNYHATADLVEVHIEDVKAEAQGKREAADELDSKAKAFHDSGQDDIIGQQVVIQVEAEASKLREEADDLEGSG